METEPTNNPEILQGRAQYEPDASYGPVEKRESEPELRTRFEREFGPFLQSMGPKERELTFEKWREKEEAKRKSGDVAKKS